MARKAKPALPSPAMLRANRREVTALAYVRVGGIQCVRVKDTDGRERDYAENAVLVRSR